VEQLDINYGQGMMLLPITVEHTIDERSPLWGHSHDSLLVRHLWQLLL
jgi:Inward rectifier potassium channel C-terminal domain